MKRLARHLEDAIDAGKQAQPSSPPVAERPQISVPAP
jgi:hypothetical protein